MFHDTKSTKDKWFEADPNFECDSSPRHGQDAH